MGGGPQIHWLQQRLAKAPIDCAAWRAAGWENQSLEDCFLVEALELQRQQEITQHGPHDLDPAR